MKGIRADIYRPARGRFANGGLSDDPEITQVTIIDPDIVGPFEPTPEAPAVRLVWRSGTIHAEPIEQPEGKLGPMMGGCYIAAPDSRLTKVIGFYGAIALHDRYESQAQYDSLST